MKFKEWIIAGMGIGIGLLILNVIVFGVLMLFGVSFGIFGG